MSLAQFSKQMADNNGTSNASQYHKWFYENAKTYHDVDETKSIDLAKKLRSEPKQCYKNSAIAVLISDEKLRYIEGFMDYKGIPIAHAFILDENNKVIDITLGIDPKIRSEKAKKYGLDLSEDKLDNRFSTEYYGVEIPKNKIMKHHNTKEAIVSPLFSYWLKEIRSK